MSFKWAPDDLAVDMEALAELVAAATWGTANKKGDSASFYLSRLLDFLWDILDSSLYDGEKVLSNRSSSWSSPSSSTSSREFLSI